MPADLVPALDALERIASDALYRAETAWRFIHQEEPPEGLERSIRAHVFGGADVTTIVGAITIAAQKKDLAKDSQWVYACGIIRNQLAARDVVDHAVADVQGTAPPPETWRDRFRRVLP